MSASAFIQARMASTRLPGKVLTELLGKPMLWHVIRRAKAAARVDQVVVLTSEDPANDPLEEFCRAQGVPVFRGSENDVLDRFYQAARRFRADPIVRITADCPLLDPEVLDRALGEFAAGGSDYVTNTFRYTYPDGLDVEVFSFAALERAWKEASLDTEREHVTPYIRNSGKFRVRGFEREPDLSALDLRWTVDNSEDLHYIREIVSGLDGADRIPSTQEVLDFLERKGWLGQKPAHIRNEGYYLSILRETSHMETLASLNLTRSKELSARAAQLIPSETQTFSKGPNQFVRGISPTFLERGEGCRVWDVDGNEFIDYAASLGAVILGHNYPRTTEAAVEQVRRGASFSLPHRLEVEVSELLVDCIPCAEMVRFGKNGSDATSGAVRVARAYTGREVVLCCGYHGWQDWYIGTTTRNLGVPGAVQELTRTFPYNDLPALEKLLEEHAGKVAAIIMEPVGVVEPAEGFLAGVRRLADKHGAVLIFDEVVTGFRFGLGGAQEHFGVTPDLGCFGKAMGNGFPIAAVVGKREIMRVFDDVFYSFTFGGEAVSLAVTRATILEMKEQKVFEHLWEQGGRLKDGYNVFARELGLAEVTACVGYGPRTVMTFKGNEQADDLLVRSLVQQELIERGILFLVGNNMMFTHQPADVEQTLRAYKAALEALAAALKSGDPTRCLRGKPVEAVFRRA